MEAVRDVLGRLVGSHIYCLITSRLSNCWRLPRRNKGTGVLGRCLGLFGQEGGLEKVCKCVVSGGLSDIDSVRRLALESGVWQGWQTRRLRWKGLSAVMDRILSVFLRCLCPLDNFVEMESGDRRFGYLGDWWSYRLRMATGGLRCSGLNRG